MRARPCLTKERAICVQLRLARRSTVERADSVARQAARSMRPIASACRPDAMHRCNLHDGRSAGRFTSSEMLLTENAIGSSIGPAPVDYFIKQKGALWF